MYPLLSLLFNILTQNSDCTPCLVAPKPQNAFDGTWHDSSQLPGGPAVSVTLSFTGTAIYVFCILANTVPGTVTTADYAFTLDGASSGTYSHAPDSTSNYIYGANVYSAEGLEQGSHQVVVTTDNPSGSLLLFDYAVYTFDDGESPTPSPNPPTTPPPATATVIEATTAHQEVVTLPGQSQSSTSTSGFTASSSSIHLRSTVSASSGNPTPTNINTSSSPIMDSTASPSLYAPSPSSMVTPATTLAAKSSRLVPILAGSLIPLILLLLVAGIIIFRRRRRRKSKRKEWEETRAHPIDVESHSEGPTGPIQRNTAVSRVNVDSQWSRPDTQFQPDSRMEETQYPFLTSEKHDWNTSSHTSVSTVAPEPALSRSPTFVTVDYYNLPTSPPPNYDSQPRRLPTIPSPNS
ncbi:hypothetical protein B0H10DRAFT_2221630 [Mycena sp. CBHHK59/15]|nr:hypothetical protein B0H10DRAFT_2221630 [Mycena sp. CBHHK59/15]